jgi:hypothetical protein
MENTRPSDLPFPYPEEKWLERDVLPEDWQTFINYLIPYHADISNSEVADRKMKAELIDERMERLTLNTDSGRTDSAKIDAQLSPLRHTHADPSVVSNIDTVIKEWNEGFFGPRGLLIEIAEPAPETRAMPGSWTEDPADIPTGINQGGQDAQDAQGHRRGFRGSFGGGWIRADDTGFHIGRGLMSADHNGFRLGGNALVADNNGFRIGNLLVADGNGFKLGPLKADSSGLRFGGSGFGSANQFRDVREAPRASRLGFRPPSPHKKRSRSRSVSSSSSDSSSTSVESTGSLPDWDKLNDAQLPVMKQSVMEWLTNPEKPITKETVSNIKKEVKAAKSAKSQPNYDSKALRQEVRDMLREFRELQRTQKRVKKAAKRERRSLRRIAKKQDRMTKRLERKVARREKRRELPPWANPASPIMTMPAVVSPHPPHGHRHTDNAGSRVHRQPPFPMGSMGTRLGFMELSALQRQRTEEQRQLAKRYSDAMRQKLTATARRSEANTFKNGAAYLEAQVNRIRAQAALIQDEEQKQARLSMARRLENEAERKNAKYERLMAEAARIENGEQDSQASLGEPEQQHTGLDSDQGQETGVIND